MADEPTMSPHGIRVESHQDVRVESHQASTWSRPSPSRPGLRPTHC